MRKSSVEAVVGALNERRVDYLIVGGLAVVAHGYVRFTADIDLALAVEPDNLKRAVAALQALGYRPRAPVAFELFLDPAERRRWAAEKNMVVFSLFSPQHPTTEVDLFLDPPLNFAEARGRAVRQSVAAGVEATFCGLADLIAMKTAAARPRDADDVAELRRLHKMD